jgi:dihydroxyacetone kinase-like protein
MFEYAAKAVIANSQYLSELDMIGDADFGVNVSTGFQRVLKELKALRDPDIGQVLQTAGDVFVFDIGATIGALIGRAFQRAGEAMHGQRALGSGDLVRIMQSILGSVREIGGAHLGDKTLIDALEPAVNAGTAAKSKSDSVWDVLHDMAEAAEAGANSTESMISRVGRSSYLGERSRGTIDPGAKLISILLCAMSDFFESNSET